MNATSPSLGRRLRALETRTRLHREPLVIVRRIVTPGNLDALPVGTLPALPHLPAVDCLPGEGWEDFSARLSAMVANLAAGTVVQVTSRHNAEFDEPC